MDIVEEGVEGSHYHRTKNKKAELNTSAHRKTEELAYCGTGFKTVFSKEVVK